MPLYEYLCSACAHRFERIVKFSDPPLKKCPRCGKEALEQLISAPAVQFKGSGWYVTDYARKNSVPESSSKPASNSEAASASKSNGGGDGASSTASGSSEKSSGSSEKSASTSAAPAATSSGGGDSAKSNSPARESK
jgi:putative FmdB family regulatory protein